MGVFVGGKAKATSNLVFSIDCSNRQSTIRVLDNKTLINTAEWTIGTTSTTNYTTSETVAGENARIGNTDPWGANSIVWQTRPSGDSNADGGWNSSYRSCDPALKHRFTVWVRRISTAANGSYYYGGYATGSGTAVVPNSAFMSLTTSTTEETNPYWNVRSPSSYTQNIWYLSVGHLFPSDYPLTTPDKTSGEHVYGNTAVYRNNSGNLDNLDARMHPNTNNILHRTYHYYCTEANTKLEFAFPRIDPCDGSEPSISELMNNGPNILRNTANTMQKSTLYLQPTYTYSQNGGYFTFNGTNQWLGTDTINLTGTADVTVEMVLRLKSYVETASSAKVIFEFSPNYNSYTDAFVCSYADDSYSPGAAVYPIFLVLKGNVGYNGSLFSKTLLNDLNWHHFVAIFSKSSANPETSLYVDGVEATSIGQPSGQTNNNTNNFGNYAFNIAARSGGTVPGNFDLAYCKMYNKKLSAEEVTYNYNIMRNRYGI